MDTKEICIYNCTVLKEIFTQSLQTGYVHMNWKLTANITAIFKKGDRIDPGSYRAVSITLASPVR